MEYLVQYKCCLLSCLLELIHCSHTALGIKQLHIYIGIMYAQISQSYSWKIEATLFIPSTLSSCLEQYFKNSYELNLKTVYLDKRIYFILLCKTSSQDDGTQKVYVTGPAKIGHVHGLSNFQTFVTHNFLLQYGLATKFSEIVHNLNGFPTHFTEPKCYISVLRYVPSNDTVYFCPHALFLQTWSHTRTLLKFIYSMCRVHSTLYKLSL